MTGRSVQGWKRRLPARPGPRSAVAAPHPCRDRHVRRLHQQRRPRTDYNPDFNHNRPNHCFLRPGNLSNQALARLQRRQFAALGRRASSGGRNALVRQKVTWVTQKRMDQLQAGLTHLARLLRRCLPRILEVAVARLRPSYPAR